MVKNLEDAAFFLPVHRVSQEVRNGFGYHLIRVERIKKPVRRTYHDAKRKINARLEKDTTTELEDRLRGKYGVKMDYTVLGI